MLRVLLVIFLLIGVCISVPVVEFVNANILSTAGQAAAGFESDLQLGAFTGVATAVKVSGVTVSKGVNIIQTQFVFGNFNPVLGRFQLQIGNAIPSYVDGFYLNIYKDDPANSKPSASIYAAATTEMKVNPTPVNPPFPKATITSAGFAAKFSGLTGAPSGTVFNVFIINAITKFGVVNNPFWLEIRAVLKNNAQHRVAIWAGAAAGTNTLLDQVSTNLVTGFTYSASGTNQANPYLSLEYDNSQANNDPHITGFMGQKFDFCGYPDNVFNYYSDPRIQINTLLKQVKLPEKPHLEKKTVDSKTASVVAPPVDKNSCMYRANHTVGTYITSAGIKFADNADTVILTTNNGTFTVVYKGNQVYGTSKGKTITLACGSMTYIDREKWAKIFLYNDGYEFTIDTDGYYLNIQLTVPLYSYSLSPSQVSGYVGQTLDTSKPPSDVPENFLVNSSDLFSNDYPNSPFTPNSVSVCHTEV